MSECLTFEYQVSGDDFTRAGEASSDVKNKLKMMGVDSGVIRRVAIAMYEGEEAALKSWSLTTTSGSYWRTQAPASRTWKKPCSRATPPPRRRCAPWALAPVWVCPT